MRGGHRSFENMGVLLCRIARSMASRPSESTVCEDASVDGSASADGSETCMVKPKLSPRGGAIVLANDWAWRLRWCSAEIAAPAGEIVSFKTAWVSSVSLVGNTRPGSLMGGLGSNCMLRIFTRKFLRVFTEHSTRFDSESGSFTLPFQNPNLFQSPSWCAMTCF